MNRAKASAPTAAPKPAAPAPKPTNALSAGGSAAMSRARASSPSPSPAPSRLGSALSSVKKFRAENYDAMVRYMIGEGYATDEDSARAIVEHMSDAWVADLMG